MAYILPILWSILGLPSTAHGVGHPHMTQAPKTVGLVAQGSWDLFYRSAHAGPLFAENARTGPTPYQGAVEARQRVQLSTYSSGIQIDDRVVSPKLLGAPPQGEAIIRIFFVPESAGAQW